MKERPVIVVATPDAETRAALFPMLEETGALVATAATGLETLRYVAEHKPALVIGSRELPDFGGAVLMRRVRENSPSTRFLLLGRDVPAKAGKKDFLRMVKCLLDEAPVC